MSFPARGAGWISGLRRGIGIYGLCRTLLMPRQSGVAISFSTLSQGRSGPPEPEMKDTMVSTQIPGHAISLDIDSAVDDLSGVVKVGDYLLLGNDEGHRLLVCRSGAQPDTWAIAHSVDVSSAEDETDIEALTYADGFLYVVGSHSLRRRSLKPDGMSVRQNRKRFARIDRQKTRNRLYRIPFDKQSGLLGKPSSINLSKRLRKDAFLGPFTRIPSKENGIDIEGMAAHQTRLFLGFRGPVLRHNLVPVMVLDFDRPKRYELRFVDLQGQGIRDMVSLGDALLLLAGPVGDAPGPFRLWLWEGRDQLPGIDRCARPAALLGDVGVPPGGRAEGLALLKAKGERVDLLLVIDGVGSQRAQRFSLEIPAQG